MVVLLIEGAVGYYEYGLTVTTPEENTVAVERHPGSDINK